jgi:hypothetical protein
MNAGVKLGVLALIAAPLVVLADDESKLSCKDFTYSQEFLEKYPQAGGACREVVMKDGQKWVRFEGEIKSVEGKQVTADIQSPHGVTLSTITIEGNPDARVQSGRGQKRFDQLRRGNKLTIWLAESQVGFYAEPGQHPTKFAVVNRTETQR